MDALASQATQRSVLSMVTTKAAKSKAVLARAENDPTSPAVNAAKPGTTTHRATSARGFKVGQPVTQRTKLPAQTFEQIASRLRDAAK